MLNKLYKIILVKRINTTFAFNELKNAMSLKDRIKKIEAYDISHISGDHAVSSCVVFSNQGPQKKEYRTFNIPKELSGNDVGSLEHVLERRIKYYDDPNIKPDIILIDGGKTQLKYSKSVIDKSIYNDIEVISIVKGSNRVRATETILADNGIVELDKYSKAYLVLQEMRDESHRFAITAQRKKKSGSIKKSQLDLIPGIGPALKNRVLLKFKSLKNIKSANIEDLMTVRGINDKIAYLIKHKYQIMVTFINLLTFSRILLAAIIFLLLMSSDGYLLALILFYIAGFTDWLDGYLARKYHAVSQLGEILDPIADKILIVFVFFGLAVNLSSYLIGFFASLIITREIWVGALRDLNARNNKSNATKVTFLAKIKTTIQLFTISIYLIALAFNKMLLIVIADIFLFASLFITLYTGFLYTLNSFNSNK